MIFSFYLRSIHPSNKNREEVIKEANIKPHQPRFMSPLCHVTASSASGDLLHTLTDGDDDLSGLVDSGAAFFLVLR